MLFFKQALIIIAIVALLACSRQEQPAENKSRVVSLGAYTQDLSCWGSNKNGRVSLASKAIITSIGLENIAIFPISENCHLKRSGNPFAFLNVRIGSFIKNANADHIMMGRSLDPWLNSEASYVNDTSVVYDLTATCRAEHPNREPSSLVFWDCELLRAEPIQSLTEKFIDAI
jgi:hypothetical protein